MSPIEDFLPEGFRRRSNVLHGLLLADLAAEASSRARICHVWSQAAELLELLVAHIHDVIATPNPFFWLSVYRARNFLVSLRDCMNADDRNEETVVNNLLVMIFDGFQHILPVGLRITIYPCLEEIALPKCAIKVPPSHDSRNLFIGSSGFQLQGSHFTPETAVGLGSSLILNDKSSLRLIHGQFGNLFESAYISELQPETATVSGLTDMLSDTISLICSVVGNGYPVALEQLSFIAAIKTDSIETHRSFTSPQLRGVIFLSEGKDRIRLSEAIIHELSHNALNAVLDCDHIDIETQESNYYSPWRDDRRPLVALFHAIFVFSQVSRWFMALEGARISSSESAFLQSRFDATYHRLRLGIMEIPKSLLSETGRSIFDRIANQAEIFGDWSGSSRRVVPDVVSAHFERHHPTGELQ